MNREKFSEKELEEAWERNKKSTKYKNGSIWQSESCGDFEIIGKFDTNNLYIRFLNTGTIAIKNNNSILRRRVKDYYSPSVCNVGYRGEGEYSKTSHLYLYRRWHAMLTRCYGDSDKFPSYKDVTVDSRWHNFQNFAEDITNMMTEQGIEDLDGYAIDKDIKQTSGAKIYSKDTVSLVTWHENNDEMLNRVNNTAYIAENLSTGEKVEFTNQSQFAREHNLYSTHISRILRGERKSAKNWTFYKKEE